jgi:hypothetical protein
MQNALAFDFFFVFHALIEVYGALNLLVIGMLIRVMSNLKEYAVKALVNTVDHLGSVSFKFSSLIDQRFDEVTDANLRVSCIQQVSK